MPNKFNIKPMYQLPIRVRAHRLLTPLEQVLRKFKVKEIYKEIEVIQTFKIIQFIKNDGIFKIIKMNDDIFIFKKQHKNSYVKFKELTGEEKEIFINHLKSFLDEYIPLAPRPIPRFTTYSYAPREEERTVLSSILTLEELEMLSFEL